MHNLWKLWTTRKESTLIGTERHLSENHSSCGEVRRKALRALDTGCLSISVTNWIRKDNQCFICMFLTLAPISGTCTDTNYRATSGHPHSVRAHVAPFVLPAFPCESDTFPQSQWSAGALWSGANASPLRQLLSHCPAWPKRPQAATVDTAPRTHFFEPRRVCARRHNYHIAALQVLGVCVRAFVQRMHAYVWSAPRRMWDRRRLSDAGQSATAASWCIKRVHTHVWHPA